MTLKTDMPRSSVARDFVAADKAKTSDVSDKIKPVANMLHDVIDGYKQLHSELKKRFFDMANSEQHKEFIAACAKDKELAARAGICSALAQECINAGKVAVEDANKAHDEQGHFSRSISKDRALYLSRIEALNKLYPDLSNHQVSDTLYPAIFENDYTNYIVNIIGGDVDNIEDTIKGIKSKIDHKKTIVEDGWITLNAKSGEDESGGTHVFVGENGNIEKGASGLVGKSLDDLGGTQKFTKHKINTEKLHSGIDKSNIKSTLSLIAKTGKSPIIKELASRLSELDLSHVELKKIEQIESQTFKGNQ